MFSLSDSDFESDRVRNSDHGKRVVSVLVVIGIMFLFTFFLVWVTVDSRAKKELTAGEEHYSNFVNAGSAHIRHAEYEKARMSYRKILDLYKTPGSPMVRAARKRLEELERENPDHE